MGGLPAQDTALQDRAGGHPAESRPPRSTTSRPLGRGEEGPPVADELRGLPARRGEGRSRGPGFLSAQPNGGRARQRRHLGPRLVGLLRLGLQGPEAEAGGGAQDELYAVRLHVHRQINTRTALPGRERLDRAATGAEPGPGRPAGSGLPRHRRGANRLRRSRPAVNQVRIRLSNVCVRARNLGSVKKPEDHRGRLRHAAMASIGSPPAGACWPAGT